VTRIAALVATVMTIGAALAGTDDAPVQPVPFSHKSHAGMLGLPCTKCHTNPDPGELMTFPALATCMECHAVLKAESPHIQTVASAAERGESLDWRRVYEIPGYVYFSHRAHLGAGAQCATCHGAVSEQERLFREGDISMTGCMNCHLESAASLDCAYCHEPFDATY
jgi:hypothetical protein